jgi:alpha-N-arabinofuranosidase
MAQSRHRSASGILIRPDADNALINNLHCLFLAREDQFVVTPNYHVFRMYADHRGAQAVRALFAAKQHGNLTGLAGSASIQGKTLVLTAVNTDAAQTLETEIILRGAASRSATVSTLAHQDIHAHNTFSNPNVVQVREETIEAQGSAFTYRFPPASVNKLVVELV